MPLPLPRPALLPPHRSCARLDRRGRRKVYPLPHSFRPRSSVLRLRSSALRLPSSLLRRQDSRPSRSETQAQAAFPLLLDQKATYTAETLPQNLLPHIPSPACCRSESFAALSRAAPVASPASPP